MRQLQRRFKQSIGIIIRPHQRLKYAHLFFDQGGFFLIFGVWIHGVEVDHIGRSKIRIGGQLLQCIMA
ncbi:Uncharacterised protein [Vibrio cholerae]|nr:Uncharacterised protein [Vibrio cholerae]